MKIVPFHPDHVAELKMQPAQDRIRWILTPEYIAKLGSAGPALTAIHDSTILGCAGIGFMRRDCGVLWGMVSASAGAHFVAIHRAVTRFIQANPLVRLEATAESTFAPACRWLELLGFENEGLMRKYGPDGADYVRYARIS
jgi:RimJ/RimL family protein N-acetyltransferase